MSALAQWLRADGWQVRGTDSVRSEVTDILEREGISVEVGSSAAIPPETILLVYSDAVPAEHPLRRAASERGIRSVSYATLLGELTKSFATVALAGSHGKSTPSALVGLLLDAAGKDPTVVVGTRVQAWQGRGVGNFRPGKSSIAVVEADEYRNHFLSLTPTVAVVTSVDHDHVDAFPTPASYEAAFAEFVRLVRPGGTVVLAVSDQAAPALRDAVTPGVSVLTFALGSEGEEVDVRASRSRVAEEEQVCSLRVRGEDWGTFSLRVPGAHMASNVAAAVAATVPFGMTPEIARRVVSEFRGTWRRFEHVGTINGAPLISDYAHHPTELAALLAAARQRYPGRRLLIAFQPHQRARTRAFASEFIQALKAFDSVVLAEVYDVVGREEGEPITTETWVELLRSSGRRATYAPTLAAVADAIRTQVEPDEVVLIVGAGDIDTVARDLARTTGQEKGRTKKGLFAGV